MGYRTDAVREALDEWEAHPEGRPALYWQEVLRPEDLPFSADWCGAFALRSLKKAGMARGVFWQIGLGFISPLNLPQVRTPLPGDILVVPAPFQHQALVVSYDPITGMVTSIDGNQPGIKPQVRFVGKGNLDFYSIQPLVDEAEARFPWVWLGATAVVVAAAALLFPGPINRALARVGI